VTYEELRTKAREELTQGDARSAFATFRPALDYPGLLDSDRRWTDALGLFALIAGAMAGEALEKQIRETTLDDPASLYNLGYELVEQGFHGIAATVLARADRLAPGEESVITEFVAALERAGRHQEACAVLRRDAELLESSLFCSYLLAFNAMMTGDLDEPRARLPVLRRIATPDQAWAAERIGAFLARADAVRAVSPLDAGDLRGWHFVLGGSLLLHLSPYGMDAGMAGRYAFLQDSEATCVEGIRRVEAVLNAWGAAPPRIFELPDRNSAILAHAASALLKRPLAPWPSDDPGLIVAYDLSSLGELDSLREHRPSQILWSHALCWTRDHPVTPDLVTLMHQHNASPWEPRLVLDSTTKKMTKSEAVKGTSAELGARTAATPAESLEDLPHLLDLARAVKPQAAAFRTMGLRERHFESSPVKSSRFA